MSFSGSNEVRNGRRRQLLTRLHAHKGAPDEDSRAVEQACNGITQDQDDVGPVPVDIALQVAPCSMHRAHGRLSAGGPISAEKRRFLVWGAACGVCTHGQRGAGEGDRRGGSGSMHPLDRLPSGGGLVVIVFRVTRAQQVLQVAGLAGGSVKPDDAAGCSDADPHDSSFGQASGAEAGNCRIA